MVNIVGLLGFVIGLCIAFLPSALAVLRGNVFKGQVIKYQLIVLAVNILVSVVVALLRAVFKIKFLMTLFTIGSGLWAIVAIVLWFYILLNALRDTEMTLLSRFGINI